MSGSTSTMMDFPISTWPVASLWEKGIILYPLKQLPAPLRTIICTRNNGDGTFTDVTNQAGIAANVFGTAAIAADYDNDGFVDLFVTSYLERRSSTTIMVTARSTDVTAKVRNPMWRAGRSVPPGSITIATAAWDCPWDGM